ncbi:MAG: hypothetical protein H6626_05800 [Pseudobdellovibrionaceae bacterium]|nr:hypothetical protein [Bdellovibrionales bacterium]USN48607.1 MAG: hypothetical protein H6626_05800 [Pseudobdellovibrionaceae bacterium]
MKALRINKNKIGKMALFSLFFVSVLSLSGCGDDSKSRGGVVGPGPQCLATNCVNYPNESFRIGFALGNAFEYPGVQVALEFFTDQSGYPGAGYAGAGQSVFVSGSVFVSQGLPCGLEPGRYNVTGVLQPGVLNGIDMINGLVFEAKNANGPSRMVVSMSNGTIKSRLPKLRACDNSNIDYDELVAGLNIEQTGTNNSAYGYPGFGSGGYCGVPVTVMSQEYGAQPACF